jgi:hypothetical protein
MEATAHKKQAHLSKRKRYTNVLYQGLHSYAHFTQTQRRVYKWQPTALGLYFMRLPKK